jgi:xanthine permease
MFDQLPTMLKMLLQNGIVTGSLTAVILNLLLVHWNKNLSQTAAAEGSPSMTKG